MEIVKDDCRQVEELRYKSKGQTFDRKSARIKARDLAVPIIAMANADGGEIAIGIEDNGDVTGVAATRIISMSYWRRLCFSARLLSKST